MISSNSSEVGKAIALISQAIRSENKKTFVETGEALLSLCEDGKVSSSLMPVFLLYSALSYEIAGELIRGRNAYNKLNNSPLLPVKESIKSDNILKNFNRFWYNFGRRDIDDTINVANDIFDEIKYLQKSYDMRFSDSNDDETITFLGVIEIILSYLESTKKQDLAELSALSQYLQDFSEKLTDSDASPWLILLARLAIKSVNSLVERNIIKINLPRPVASELIKQRIIEFWEPQKAAIDNGILDGKSLLLTMPTSSGKTFLSTVVSSFSSPTRKSILISPTRTLVQEIFTKINDYVSPANIKAAISTREKVNFDNTLSSYSILVATYEKFSSLLRKGLVSKQSIKSLIVDEAHYISDPERGVQLEFLIKNLRDASNQTQIIGLSGMIDDEDSEKLSSWIKGKNIKNSWRPVDLDEIVYFDAKYYYKNGAIVETPIKTIKTLTHEASRFLVAQRLAREETQFNRQCMIIIPSREKTERECQQYFENLFVQQTLFTSNAEDNVPARETFANEIKSVEPELPPFAESLAKMIQKGIAYHHAGLPEQYRSIVERAVRNRAINVLFTTTTFEAGVNLPVSTIIFPDPFARVSSFSGMTVSKYKNIAGRAGRPGLDRHGKSILIALSEEERDELFEKLVNKEADKIQSSIHNFLKKVPTSRYAIQSEILNLFSEKIRITKNEIVNHVEDTWFMQTATPEQKNQFRNSFAFEIDKLWRYGCVNNIDGYYSLTRMGETARVSTLFPFSITMMINNLKRIISSIVTDEQFDILILSLVGLAWELRSHDNLMENVIVSEDTKFVTNIIKDDGRLYERYQRASMSPKFGTVLWYWINSVPTNAIIEKCGLNNSQSSFIEETLKEDAFWILNAIANFSSETVHLHKPQRDRIIFLANACKLGSSNPIVKDIMELNLKHIHRSTALKLAEYLQTKMKITDSITMKDLQSISQEEMKKIFPRNLHSAMILFKEIQFHVK